MINVGGKIYHSQLVEKYPELEEVEFEWINFASNFSGIYLDGTFDSKGLRMLADIMDKEKSLKEPA